MPATRLTRIFAEKKLSDWPFAPQERFLIVGIGKGNNAPLSLHSALTPQEALPRLRPNTTTLRFLAYGGLIHTRRPWRACVARALQGECSCGRLPVFCSAAREDRHFPVLCFATPGRDDTKPPITRSEIPRLCLQRRLVFAFPQRQHRTIRFQDKHVSKQGNPKWEFHLCLVKSHPGVHGSALY